MKKRKLLTKKDTERIKAMSKKGLSQRKIAEKMGVGRSTVWDHLQK